MNTHCWSISRLLKRLSLQMELRWSGSELLIVIKKPYEQFTFDWLFLLSSIILFFRIFNNEHYEKSYFKSWQNFLETNRKIMKTFWKWSCVNIVDEISLL